MIMVPYEGNRAKFAMYMVTARHCIEEQQGTIFIRINTNYRGDQGFVDVPTKKDDWIVHDQADVAVIFFKPPVGPSGSRTFEFQGNLDIDKLIDGDSCFRGDPLPAAARRQGVQVAVGDDVFFTGLFVQHAGTEQNLPIARFGAIARMPAEPISFKTHRGSLRVAIHAYLVEAHSWGGHSGSPAFWSFFHALVENNILKPIWLVGLLGLVSAHFDIPQETERSGELHNLEGDVKVAINSGIAVVTPASAIKELLMREVVVEDRRLRQQAAGPDESVASADSGMPRENVPFTAEAFEGALKKVSRRRAKPSPPDEASSGT
jgi:hypothetical protein